MVLAQALRYKCEVCSVRCAVWSAEIEVWCGVCSVECEVGV